MKWLEARILQLMITGMTDMQVTREVSKERPCSREYVRQIRQKHGIQKVSRKGTYCVPTLTEEKLGQLLHDLSTSVLTVRVIGEKYGLTFAQVVGICRKYNYTPPRKRRWVSNFTGLMETLDLFHRYKHLSGVTTRIAEIQKVAQPVITRRLNKLVVLGYLSAEERNTVTAWWLKEDATFYGNRRKTA